ncbi:MAG: hypothetical protein P4L16_00250 [Chlamydiales bacterium]|nr:hypothetical protein [Chlamydiales bacterium]
MVKICTEFENDGSWTEVLDFRQKGRLVNETGQKITCWHMGRKFQIEKKYEKPLLLPDKISRALLCYTLCFKCGKQPCIKDKTSIYVVKQLATSTATHIVYPQEYESIIDPGRPLSFS